MGVCLSFVISGIVLFVEVTGTIWGVVGVTGLLTEGNEKLFKSIVVLLTGVGCTTGVVGVTGLLTEGKEKSFKSIVVFLTGVIGAGVETGVVGVTAIVGAGVVIGVETGVVTGPTWGAGGSEKLAKFIVSFSGGGVFVVSLGVTTFSAI